MDKTKKIELTIAAIVAIAAILALIPAFGQWLSPRAPISNSLATSLPTPATFVALTQGVVASATMPPTMTPPQSTATPAPTKIPTLAFQPSTAVPESSPVDVVEHYYQLLNNRDYDGAWAMFTLRFQQNQPAKNLSEYKAWAENINGVSLQPPKIILEQTDTQATVQIGRVLYSLQSNSDLIYDNFHIYLRRETPNQDWLIDGIGSEK